VSLRAKNTIKNENESKSRLFDKEPELGLANASQIRPRRERAGEEGKKMRTMKSSASNSDELNQLHTSVNS
jgi:hypothetical protein